MAEEFLYGSDIGPVFEQVRGARMTQDMGMQTVGQAVANAAALAVEKPKWDPKWSRFAGLYRNGWGDTVVVELAGRLVMINPTGTNPESQTKLIPLGNDRFRFEATTGGGVVGEVVRFVEENGRVVRMFTGDSYTDRVIP